MDFELNHVRKDIDDGKIGKRSVVAEVFAAMVNGESLSKFNYPKSKIDEAVNFIKNLGARAESGDWTAVSELNTLRKYVVELPVMEEVKLLSVFGTYQALGFDETVEREVWHESGEHSRIQAPTGDVVFPALWKETYTVPTFTVSGGYAVDYRRVALGDMSKENEGIARVKVDMLNKAKAAVIKKVHDAINSATGIKYVFEAGPLTKEGVDKVITNVRRMGPTTVVGDYAVLSQFAPWAGYVGSVSSNTITGISEAAMEDIRRTGLLAMYNGSVLSEISNPYNFNALNAAGDNYATMLPAGLAFVIPTGVNSPIALWTKGGITTLTGNDVKTGKIITRFDLETAVDVAKGQENRIGMIYDTQVAGL